MKKLISIFSILLISITILISFNLNSSLALTNDSILALNDEVINSSSTSLTINSLNDAEKQLSTDGTRILNTINESKSNLDSGELAIDIIITNPANASKKEAIGVRISYDTEILGNFNIIDLSVTKGTVQFNTDNNQVEWALASIESNETVTLSYKLKLKSTIDRSLLDRLLKTNRQIVVTEWGSVIGTYPEDSQIGIQICSPTIRIISTTGELSVSKIVRGDGANLNKNFNFTVTLSDRTINGTYGSMNFTNGVANIALKHGQTLTATNLPANITYRVVETEANLNNYITSSTGETGTILASQTSYAQFTNTYKKPVGNLIVKKIVEGSSIDTSRNFNFTVTLSDKTINGTYGNMNFTNGVAKFTLKHNQSLMANSLPVDVTYTVEETDANTDNYVTVYDDGLGKRTYEKVTGTIKENTNSTVTVYNTKEDKNFIIVNKQFDTTTNFNKDIEINYTNFQNNGVTLETYKKYIASKSITIQASNGNIHTNFIVKSDSNGKFTIPAKYAVNYNNYNILIDNLNLNLKLEKVIPNIPNSIDFSLKASNATSGIVLEKDFTLNSSESYMKSFEIDYDISLLNNIKIIEKANNNDWDFSYQTKKSGNSISIIMSNKAGEYKVSGTLAIETTPKPQVTIEKIWTIEENYIDIYFTSEHRSDFRIDVKITDKNDKILETVTLDETGHGITSNKYPNSKELYAIYPDGKKVKINFDETQIPKEIKVTIGNEIYILSSNNNWKMTINKEIDENTLIDEIETIGNFTSSVNKTKDNNGNYEIKITNTHASTRNVSYNEPEKPIENPKTGINKYYAVGITIITVAISGLVILNKKHIF